MRIGLVGCSALKLPVPAPAWLLYSASPRFVQSFQVARRECDTIRILSARYGVVTPTQPLEPYNVHLATLSASEQACWGTRVRAMLQTLEGDLVSYCSTAYNRLLAPLPLVIPYAGGLFQRARRMGRHASLRPIDWPMQWLLVFLHTHPGITLALVARAIAHRGYAAATVQAQLQRIRRCPLYIISRDRVFPRPLKEERDAVDSHENVSL